MSRNLRQSLILTAAALIWGFAFVAQSVGMDYLGPFSFSCIRNLIGTLVLLPCIAILEKIAPDDKEKLADTPTLIKGGVTCGILLFLAANAQQIGIQYTTVGKAGFITALYIIIVPVLGLFFKKHCGLNIWIAVGLALIGFYRLSIQGETTLSTGDLWMLLCSLLFSFQILAVDHYSPLVNGVKLSAIQFFVCGLLSGVVMLIRETPTWESIIAAWKPLLYAGVLSSGVAYTFQIIGQKDFNPTVASLLMSLESVFSALAGWLLLGQVLSFRELTGCMIIFAAILLAQLPSKKICAV